MFTVKASQLLFLPQYFWLMGSNDSNTVEASQ